MKIDKKEIATKLCNLKSVAASKDIIGTSGILYANGVLYALNSTTTISVPLEFNTPVEPFVIPLEAIDYIKNLSADEIEINADNKKISIVTPASKVEFATFNANDFPKVESFEHNSQEKMFVCDEGIETGISKVLHCAGVAMTNPILNGVLVKGDGTTIDIVACDGVKAAVYQVTGQQKINFVLPRQAIGLMLSLAKQSIKIEEYKEKEFLFVIDDEYTIQCRKLDGIFIDYTSFCNCTGKEAKVLVNRDSLLDAINQSLLALVREKILIVKLVFVSGKLTISANCSTSKFTTEVAIDYEGSEISFAANPKFLQSMIKAANEKEIEFLIKGGLNPVLINAGALKQVVMPVRTSKGG